MALLFLTLVVPLGFLLAWSFLTRGPEGEIVRPVTLANLLRGFDLLYLKIVVRSFVVAAGTTLVALAVGYPVAYAIARETPARWKGALLTIVVLPFWTSFLVRTYAWFFLLRDEGLLNRLLTALGVFSAPVQMLYTPGAVLAGLVCLHLPLAVLPLYGAIERIDPKLLEAAEDLGAPPRQAFFRVLVPLTAPGIVAASVLVFIPALGAYIVPDLLGGARTMMIGNLIQNQFAVVRDLPFGSAAAVLLTLVVLAALALSKRLTGEAVRFE